MIDVKMIACTNQDALKLASHAALKCYQARNPEFGKTIDVKNRLFMTGHHTTLEHSYFTFSIEGVAVGDVTFGLHLTHPFYNTDQRSGRFCAEMFKIPNWDQILGYVKFFWSDQKNSRIIDYVKKGIDIFHHHMPAAVDVATRFIKDERPMASKKHISDNAPKMAQEQMRVFIPVIFPTGLDYTIDLVTLASMYRTAWSPPMRLMIAEMIGEVLSKFPGLSFMFNKEQRSEKAWNPEIMLNSGCGIKTKPSLKLVDCNLGSFKIPSAQILHPVDLLHFDPRCMNNNTTRIASEVELSVSTMGQDQRHRTIARSEPVFTGDFYLPPILAELGLQKLAYEYSRDWFNFWNDVPGSLFTDLAPYGAMVRYEKNGSANAVLHEQGKRLCWCAQEEIYHLGRSLRLALSNQSESSSFLRFLEPPCRKTGKCGEGARYCGRIIDTRSGVDYFPVRRI